MDRFKYISVYFVSFSFPVWAIIYSFLHGFNQDTWFKPGSFRVGNLTHYDIYHTRSIFFYSFRNFHTWFIFIYRTEKIFIPIQVNTHTWIVCIILSSDNFLNFSLPTIDSNLMTGPKICLRLLLRTFGHQERHFNQWNNNRRLK